MSVSNERREVVEGDALEKGDPVVEPVVVVRYSTAARINHWLTAGGFVLLALSGFALFHPSLYWLTGLFGGGQWTRTIHPWFGVFLFLGFTGLFLRFWRVNLWSPADGSWLKNIHTFLAGDEDKMPEVGRFNFAQKAVFWWMGILILIMIGTGVVIWEQYFGGYTTVEQKRIAVLVHSLGAIAMVCILIVHVYGAFWARGTMTAMVKGKVSGGWAFKHHRMWLRQLARSDKTNHVRTPTGTPAE
ncbi:formate dehydrogenase subunit gamma [Rhodoplanes azumiensis]|uniref:Formate dehydrogenase subunit gamma n=1 Tax=Rhodoplanes azumiensis TaxID=1897628 RepID=A0ABW5AKS2_9BRAD